MHDEDDDYGASCLPDDRLQESNHDINRCVIDQLKADEEIEVIYVQFYHGAWVMRISISISRVHMKSGANWEVDVNLKTWQTRNILKTVFKVLKTFVTAVENL